MLVSYSRRLADFAEADPDFLAIVCGDERMTRGELRAAGDALAAELLDGGVGLGDMVTIALPNCADWFVAATAAWRLGATPQPVSPRLPTRELEAIVDLAGSKAVMGVAPDTFPGRLCIPAGHRPAPRSGVELPDAVAPAWKAPTSGGSTGRPKLIVSGDPGELDPDARPNLLIGLEECLVMPGPLYHNGPVVWSCTALLAGNRVVVLPRFDAEATLAAIDEHRATVVYLVPTMMKRIWRLPDDVRQRYDLSSLRAAWHLAEPCPDWLKQAWIDWLGAERIFELYAGTEAQAATIITGPEWLAHRGSVGRVPPGQIQVLGPDGDELGPGEMGEVWLRAARDTPTYRYVGATPRTRPGGWESLGDMGYVDADGYLYLGDRATDMILSGGANIYPAEIEAAIQEHDRIRSVAVIGLPDEDKGQCVHAIIEADPAEVDEDELRAFLGERLVAYKLPRTFEFVDSPLRDDAGKVRRSALREERMTGPGGR